jgi:hypothetical protein
MKYYSADFLMKYRQQILSRIESSLLSVTMHSRGRSNLVAKLEVTQEQNTTLSDVDENSCRSNEFVMQSYSSS